MKIQYFKDEDIMSFWLKGKTDNSRELKEVNVLVDFDKKGNITGIEIYDFQEALKRSQKEINRIFKKRNTKTEAKPKR